MATPPYHEDQLLWRVNRCISDALVKSILAGGMAVLAMKLFYPKAKTSNAVISGAAIGLGMAYLNCERDLKTALTTPCPKDEKKKRKRLLLCEEEFTEEKPTETKKK